MKGEKLELDDTFEIEYREDLTGRLSSSDLEEEVLKTWKACLHHPEMGERSETKFFKIMSEWEVLGKCTTEDLCIILGWYFDDKKDPSWGKTKNVFSLEQKEKINFPEWVGKGNGYSAYEDKGYTPTGGSGFLEWKDKRW